MRARGFSWTAETIPTPRRVKMAEKNETLTLVFLYCVVVKAFCSTLQGRRFALGQSPVIPFLFIKIGLVWVPPERIVWCGTFRFPDKGFRVPWCSRRIVVLFIADAVPCFEFYIFRG